MFARAAARLPHPSTAAAATLLAGGWALQDVRRRPLQAEEPGFSNARLTCFGEAMLRYIPDPKGQGTRSTSTWLKNAGGAELNITVALSHLGWGGRARWVSVVPHGPLGDELLELAGQAYAGGNGEESLSLVRRETGDLGIYHVWPEKKKIWYQRYRSVFGLMDPDWFSDRFWLDALSQPLVAPTPGGAAPPHVLHLTGITPQISPNAHKAWWRALRAAHMLRTARARGEGGARVVVTLDFNHRPALGPLDDLWMMVEQHLRTTDLFMLSVGNLPELSSLLCVPEVDPFSAAQIPEGTAGAEALDAAVARSLRALQEQLGYKTNIGVCLKCEQEGPPELGMPPAQLRWSMVCLKTGETISTLSTAFKHRPKEPIGGGDSWLSGVIDGLVGLPIPAGVAPAWTPEMWSAAMQRGDMLAALKQEEIGDFCLVERQQLEAALALHRERPVYAWKSNKAHSMI